MELIIHVCALKTHDWGILFVLGPGSFIHSPHFSLLLQYGQSEGFISDASRSRYQSSCQSLAAALSLDSQSDGGVLSTGGEHGEHYLFQ